MLLRNSISNTKKFFQKTLRSFKSFFSSEGDAIDYHKIPKASPFNPYSFTTTPPISGLDMTPRTATHHQDLENFYSDFTDRWECSDKGGKAKKQGSRKNNILTTTKSSTIATDQEQKEGNVKQLDVRKASTALIRNKSNRNSNKEEDHHHLYSKSKKKREERSLLVAEKLKELEMMDISNVDHVLDIEEVLHYYSRLTCPAYLDIVDKFFMEMYKEFLAQPPSPKSVNSKPKFRSVRV